MLLKRFFDVIHKTISLTWPAEYTCKSDVSLIWTLLWFFVLTQRLKQLHTLPFQIIREENNRKMGKSENCSLSKVANPFSLIMGTASDRSRSESGLSISPASFHGQLPDDYSDVFASFAFLMFSAFSFQENGRAYILGKDKI